MKYQKQYSEGFDKWLDREVPMQRKIDFIIWANGLDGKLARDSEQFKRYERLIPHFYPTVFECELFRCSLEEETSNEEAEKDRPNFYAIYWMLVERFDKDADSEEWPDLIGE